MKFTVGEIALFVTGFLAPASIAKNDFNLVAILSCLAIGFFCGFGMYSFFKVTPKSIPPSTNSKNSQKV
jgi:hypothetical protein